MKIIPRTGKHLVKSLRQECDWCLRGWQEENMARVEKGWESVEGNGAGVGVVRKYRI